MTKMKKMYIELYNRIKQITSFGEPKEIAVLVHSPRGGAAAEPNTTLRNSCL